MTDTIKYQSTLESSRYDGDLETPLSDGKSTLVNLHLLKIYLIKTNIEL